MPLRDKIDVHSHFVPQKYRQDCISQGIAHPDGVVEIPTWSETQHLQMMDSLNIQKAYLSITSPGTHLIPGDDALGRRITRECNVAAADFKYRHPDRIGYFASTPLPDVQGSIQEIDLVLPGPNGDDDPATLTNVGPNLIATPADGIAVKTNHHGTYLGSPLFDPVWQVLNAKHAVVFIHPTAPCMPCGASAAPLESLYPNPMLEFFFETARAAANLFLSGTVAKYPNITYVLSHCGGALPPMIRRICGAAPILGVKGHDGKLLQADAIMRQLNEKFYFDTAGWSFPEQVTGLLQYVKPERILYGTDFPWTPIKVVTELSRDHDRFVPEVFGQHEGGQELVVWRNAKRLFERNIGLNGNSNDNGSAQDTAVHEGHKA
ncbi:hypothetical protein RBB50_006530 [Rhinocladiella similis]